MIAFVSVLVEELESGMLIAFGRNLGQFVAVPEETEGFCAFPKFHV